MRIKKESSGAKQFESVYLNQPFSAPPIFDIKELVSIIQNRLNCHGDNLWLLQTDAPYMRKYVTDLMTDGLGADVEKSMRHTSISLMIMHDAIIYWSWEWIMEEVLKVQGLRMKHRDAINAGHLLPEEYGNALGSLEALLLEKLKWCARTAGCVLPSRPGFRDSWVSKGAGGIMFTWRKNDGLIIYERLFADRLQYCLESMVCDEDYMAISDDRTPHQDYSVLFAMLDEYLKDCLKDGKKNEAARLDAVLYRLFSDLASVHQILAMVQLHRPHAPKASFDDVKEIREGKAWRYARATFLAQETFAKCEADPVSGKFKTVVGKVQHEEDADEKYAAEIHLGARLEKFMTTPKPTGHRSTQARLNAEDKERENLSSFWEAMRERHRSTCSRIGIETHDTEADLKVLAADSDPEYVQMIQVNRDNVLAGITAGYQAKTTKGLNLDAT